MKKLILSFTISLLLTAIVAQAQNGNNTRPKKSVAILPANLYFNASQGQTQTLTINIDNSLDTLVQFQLSLSDFDRDNDAKVIYYEAGSTARSCANWLTLSNNFIEVPANSSGTIGVTLAVPDSATAGEEMKWAMVFLEGMKEKVANPKSGDINAEIEQTYRVGVQIYQTPPGVLRKELKMLSFTPLAKRGQFRVLCRNEGSVLLRCLSYIELVSAETGEKSLIFPMESGKDPFKLLPDQLRYIDFDVSTAVPKGKYTAVAFVDANDDDVSLEAAQLEIELK